MRNSCRFVSCGSGSEPISIRTTVEVAGEHDKGGVPTEWGILKSCQRPNRLYELPANQVKEK